MTIYTPSSMPSQEPLPFASGVSYEQLSLEVPSRRRCRLFPTSAGRGWVRHRSSSAQVRLPTTLGNRWFGFILKDLGYNINNIPGTQSVRRRWWRPPQQERQSECILPWTLDQPHRHSSGHQPPRPCRLDYPSPCVVLESTRCDWLCDSLD